MKRCAPGITAIRVGCVGDSNTSSGGLGKEQAYPAVLQRVLDIRAGQGEYMVGNFGRSGATAATYQMRKHRLEYSSTPRCRQALAFNADVYAVMLGTNDCFCSMSNVEDIASGLNVLLERLEAANPHAKLLMVLPPTVRSANRLHNIVFPALQRVAKEKGVELLDPGFSKDKSYQKDGVHLNPAGAAEVAEIVAEALLRLRPPSSSPERTRARFEPLET